MPAPRLPLAVVVATHERPDLLRVLLGCLTRQSARAAEIVVVDDGTRAPANEGAVRDVGATLLRVAPRTPLGTKLNAGFARTTAPWCLKLDDDDWYGERFLEILYEAGARAEADVAFIQPFVFFDVPGWRLVRSDSERCSGATLLFRRSLWERRPFRDIPREVDGWFLSDANDVAARVQPIPRPDCFLQVRHGRHLWNRMPDGTPLGAYLRRCEKPFTLPEDILDPVSLAAYRQLRPAGAHIRRPAGSEPVERSPDDVLRNSNPPGASALRRLYPAIRRMARQTMDANLLRHVAREWVPVFYRCGWPRLGNQLATICFERLEPARAAVILAQIGLAHPRLRASFGAARREILHALNGVAIDAIEGRLKSSYSIDRRLARDRTDVAQAPTLGDLAGYRVWLSGTPGATYAEAYVDALRRLARLPAAWSILGVEPFDFDQELSARIALRCRRSGVPVDLQLRWGPARMAHDGALHLLASAYQAPGGYKFDPAAARLPNLFLEDRRGELHARIRHFLQLPPTRFHDELVDEYLGVSLACAGKHIALKEVGLTLGPAETARCRTAVDDLLAARRAGAADP